MTTKPSFRAAFSLVALTSALAGCPEPLAGGSASFAQGSARPAPQPGQGEPLAKIGDLVLTTGDIEQRLNAQSPFVRARYQTDDRKKEFLENQVRFEVLAKEAFRRGYDQDPEVMDSLKKILVQKLTREEFDGRVSLKDITDDQIKAYYDSHLADYNKPEMVRASHIFVRFGDDKAKSQARAEEAQKQAADPKKVEDREAFKELVLKYSDDDGSKRNAGDLRYLSAKELEERFGKAAKDAVWAAAEMNQVTAVVEGKEGFHVFKRTGSRKPIERSLEQVKNQIRNVLYREKRTESFHEFVEGLEKELGVVLYEERLKDVKVEAGGAPPAAAGGHGGHAGHGHGEAPGVDAVTDDGEGAAEQAR